MALYYLPQYKTTTLNVAGGIDSSQTTGIIITSVVGVDITKPGIIAVTYEAPPDTTKIEYISYTSIDGSNELQGVTRGAEGVTAKSHSDGAAIGFVVSKSHINEINDLLTGVDAGIKIKTAVYDENGNEVIKTPATASAVNEITVTNAATGANPEVSATGGDTNISLKLSGKGTGKILTTGHYTVVTAASPEAAATQDLNLALGNVFNITMPAGNITLTVSNEVVGQCFLVSILQDGTGSRTVTWFSTIRWAGGSAPTLTTTASKRDTFGFVVTGTDTYDGFIVGQGA